MLEVSLFLAISGGLAVVALAALGPRLTNVRFTSAMRGLQESVTKQISASELGQNSATTKYSCTASGTDLIVTPLPGNTDSSTCVFVGRLAVFDTLGVNFRPIIALRTKAPCVDPAYSLAAIKNCNLARVMDADNTYQYSNGISRVSPDAIGYGYVKSPDNNSVYRFILQGPFSTAQFQLNVPSPINTDKKVCYQLSRRNAQLVVSATSAEPDLQFNGVCT